MKRKQTKLKSTQGFSITSDEKHKNGQVCTQRSQCRTTHKRQDC